jgi:hypothetical protein
LRKFSFDTKVHAPFEVIWELMLDRIEHPLESSMKEVRIIERHDNVVVREVRARWLLIRERVTIDRAKREIRYTFEEHPHLLFGSATMRAVPLSRQSPVAPVHLSMVVEWSPKTEEAERKIVASMPGEIESEVQGIKDEAEARVKKVDI